MKSILVSAAVMSFVLVSTIAKGTLAADPQSPPTAAQLEGAKESSVAAAAEARKAGSAASSVAAQGVTITDWYKQSVYDLSNNKVGEIVDLLLMPDGKISLLVLRAGWFPRVVGEKDVAVPFDAVQHTVKDGHVHLTLATKEDAVKSASRLRYDPSAGTWVPEGK